MFCNTKTLNYYIFLLVDANLLIDIPISQCGTMSDCYMLSGRHCNMFPARAKFNFSLKWH